MQHASPAFKHRTQSHGKNGSKSRRYGFPGQSQSPKSYQLQAGFGY
jgi:hypothetical protein